ncbi:hypothetical protein QH494_03830 [Sphingomonas sp. AR_OL41]|uniref:hypothetical protein n=1 Tax=Sphingomonas sp. AR_OL41 TaxID=3042729 RepID=UPI0024815B29|nr:hypothetical protein [Sphingomonas sp. AR_OL41]MDH7971300.1 hypothetical protein [Sphingomonas sp. AR_OL41]
MSEKLIGAATAGGVPGGTPGVSPERIGGVTTRHVFTPNRSTRSQTRLLLHLSTEDQRRVGARGRWGPVEITDLDSGARLLVRSAPCGSGCHCGAEVVRQIEPGHAALTVLDEAMRSRIGTVP